MPPPPNEGDVHQTRDGSISLRVGGSLLVCERRTRNRSGYPALCLTCGRSPAHDLPPAHHAPAPTRPTPPATQPTATATAPTTAPITAPRRGARHDRRWVVAASPNRFGEAAAVLVVVLGVAQTGL